MTDRGCLLGALQSPWVVPNHVQVYSLPWGLSVNIRGVTGIRRLQDLVMSFSDRSRKALRLELVEETNSPPMRV